MARAPEKELAGAGVKAEAAPKKVGASRERERESFILVGGLKDSYQQSMMANWIL
jgi:hypothetical protein